MDRQTTPPTKREIDWQAICDAVAGGLRALDWWLRTLQQVASNPPPAAVDDDEQQAADAAALLGVSIDATPDEIRAALRTRLADARLHPDHGGDGKEATRLISAKNFLIERVRSGWHG